MTLAVTNDPNDRNHIVPAIRNVVTRLFGLASDTSVKAEPVDPGQRAAMVADLIDKIENGYVVETTGKRVHLPNHARAYMATLINAGGE